MFRLRIATLVACCLAIASALFAATYPAPHEEKFIIRDFRFTTGESLPELRIHYRTLGEPRRDASGRVTNAVLILHGTAGAGSQFLQPQFAGELFGPGQLLDATTHFIILPDGIGHGGSSKPSDGLRMKFPRYTYDDMVRAQYQLVTEGLHVNHLKLVMGTSMGGMHTWMWGYMYPQFMNGLVPLASVPTAIAGRNRMWRKMLMDSIRDDPAWQNGDYTSQPRVGLEGALHILVLAGSAPLYWQQLAPTREAADAFVADQMERRLKTTDANDTLYQFDASREYDPSPHLEQIGAPVLAINSADDQINPPELGLMERLMPRVAHGKYILISTSEKTRGHGTHTWAAVWKEPFGGFLKGLHE